MNPSSRPSNTNIALAWALLSQTVWLPLVAIDLHDRWQAELREQQEIAEATARSSPQAKIPKTQQRDSASTENGQTTDTGLLLGSASRSPLNPAEGAGIVSEQSLSGSAPTVSSRRSKPRETANPSVSSAPTSRPEKAAQPRGNTAAFDLTITPGWQNPLLRTFNRAELLGGSLGLSDLKGAPMPPLAMAERARWQGSGDPLAPLPGAWREPMRRALHGLGASKGAPVSVTAARVVHVPSLRVRQSTPVPLAVQPDGSVDILTKPDNPAVVDEIRQWSARQTSSAQPGVTAAVVHLEPLPDAPLTPQPAPARTTSTAPTPAPVVTSSRPPAAEPLSAPSPARVAAVEPAVLPSPPPVAAAPAPEMAPPPVAAPAASVTVSPGSGASLP